MATDVSQNLIDSIRANYPFATEPYDHQVVGMAELIEHPRWALFWEQGTGKTKVVCDRLRWGFEADEFKGPILIVVPKNVLLVWPDELKLHAELKCMVLTGTPKLRQGLIEQIRPDTIVVTNYECLRSYYPTKGRKTKPRIKPTWERFDQTRKLMDCPWDVVVCDESHRIKDARTSSCRAVCLAAHHARYRWALSGTPMPNDQTDIFGQAKYLDERTFGPYITHFRNRYCVTQEIMPGVKKIVGIANEEELEAKIGSFSSRLKKEDCLDLPEKVYQTRKCQLSPKANRVYQELRMAAVARLESAAGEGQLTVQNILSESLRLLQVCGGFVPDDDGNVHELDPNAKLDLLRDVLEDTEPPVVIWAVFQREIEAIKEAIGERARTYYGPDSDKDRTETIERWRNREIDYLIASRSAREGLTLVEACTAVYFSRSYNLVDWLQSTDRIHRIGQQKGVSIISLVAQGTVDEKVGRALSKKEYTQESLLGAGIHELI